MKSWFKVGAVASAALAVVLTACLLLTQTGSGGTATAAAAPVQQAQKKLPAVISAPNENSFVAISPCRMIDTRVGTGTNAAPFTAGNVRTYYVGGTTGFAPQGGQSGGCGIPVGATAISATVTVVTPSGTGYLQSWANGSAQPATSILNYTNKTTIATGATLPVNVSSAYALKFRNGGGIAHLVVDVTGYYAKPMIALVDSDGNTYDGTTRVTNSGRLGVGQYWVEFDRSIVYCTPTVTVRSAIGFARTDTFLDASEQRVRVSVYNTAGALVDAYFYIRMSC
jgi:hypothetical protein